jgi:hypothetical protein
MIQADGQHTFIYYFDVAEVLVADWQQLAVEDGVQSLQEYHKLRLEAAVACEEYGDIDEHETAEHEHRVVENDPVTFSQAQIWIKLFVHRAKFGLVKAIAISQEEPGDDENVAEEVEEKAVDFVD